MINLIGDDVRKWVNQNSSENTKIHLYNKSEIKKGRKMGHVTYLFDKQHSFE
jgi:phosphoribosylaminoimidazole carboxylase (NCAIR synthetase)